MKIKELIDETVSRAGRSDANMLAAEVLLAFCLGADKEDLFMNPGREVVPEVREKFISLFERFFRGEPVAYLTGHKEFYGLDFMVDRNVLIPRPETELLVQKVLELVPDRADAVKILEVGTGSGCIAVSLAKRLPQALITATEISAPATEVAKKNARLHGVDGRIRFETADMFDGVDGPFDVIVANLPYIGEKKFNFVSREAREYEPHVALFGGDDGLRLYERLFGQIDAVNWKPRFLLGEFGFLQGGEIRKMLETHFAGADKKILEDYASIERIFVVGFDPPHMSRRRVCLKNKSA